MDGVGEVDGRLYLPWIAHRCRGRWKRTTLPKHQVRAVEITYGTLDDGRWYVEAVKGDGDEARPYPDEQSALQVVAAWKQRLGGQWEQVPCYPTDGWQDGERADQSSGG